MRFYHEIIQKLKDKEPFRFSRWGDGEWLCMCNETGENRDGNTYLPKLRDGLLRILYSQPDYYMGIQYGVFYNEKYVHGTSLCSVREFMISWMFVLSEINWVNGDVLHQASEYGYLHRFVNVLKTRNVIMIGSEYFKDIPFINGHITTPETDSYSYNRTIFREIECFDITGYNTDPVYLVASAMNSNIIIDLLPDSVTAIDIGSVFDPYLGRPRANYQHKMKIKPLW